MKVLVTGGAGFIGSNLSKRLLMDGYDVRILDIFSKQIHGGNKVLGENLSNAELIIGDINDKKTIASSIQDIDVIVHLAAETGTGQSMYELKSYEETNIKGTLNIIEYLLQNTHSVKKIVVASSRATNGEGAYLCQEHGLVYPKERLHLDMLDAFLEPRCNKCKNFLSPTSTNELAPFNPLSFYALTKQIQEQMILMYSKILGISAFALRYQNVYGPGQSLKNPYTGIMAIFSTLARKGELISIFEDGKESRDFVYIDDVIDATMSCINTEIEGENSYNIGAGKSTSVLEVASNIIDYFGSESDIQITGEFRVGDIRHNYADLTKANQEIGYTPKVKFKDGVEKFLDWASNQPIPELAFRDSIEELDKIGLFKKALK